MVGCGYFEIEVEGQKSTFLLSIRNLSSNISKCRSRRADSDYVYDVYNRMENLTDMYIKNENKFVSLIYSI